MDGGIVDLVDELVEVYNENFEHFVKTFNSETIVEIEQFIARLILKYVFLANDANDEDEMIIKLAKLSLEISSNS